MRLSVSLIAALIVLAVAVPAPASAQLATGSNAPGWDLPYCDGSGNLSLEDLRGQYVLIDFWATWCGPCRNVMQNNLKPLHERWGGDDKFTLVSIGLASRDTMQRQHQYCEQQGFDWEHVHDGDNSIAQAYGVRSIPRLVFVGPDGKVLADGNRNTVLQVVTQTLTRELGEGEEPQREAAHDWDLPKIDGSGRVSLESLRGKYVLLDFWATWCGPCRTVMQNNLLPLHNQYGANERFELVSIGCNWRNDTAEGQLAFAQRMNYHWTKVFDENGQVARDYGVRGIPTLTFIDPEGKVIVHGYAQQVLPVVAQTLARELGDGASDNGSGNDNANSSSNPAPGFDLANIDGSGNVSLESLRGKYVLVDFWATWCGPCTRIMASDLAPLHEEFGDLETFELISIGTNWRNDTAEAQHAFAERQDYHWLKLFDADGSVARAYGVRGIPTFAFIGPDGELIAKGYAQQILPMVREKLAELAAAE